MYETSFKMTSKTHWNLIWTLVTITSAYGTFGDFDHPSSDSNTKSRNASIISASHSGYICVTDGLFPDPVDPQRYYRCIKIAGQFYYYKYLCPDNTCFDGESNCTDASCSSSTPTPPEYVCGTEGRSGDPSSSDTYYHCVTILGKFYYKKFVCPRRYCYDSDLDLCVSGRCHSHE